MEYSNDAKQTENTVNYENLTAPHHDVLVSPLHTTRYMILFAFWIGFAGWLTLFDQGAGGTVLQMVSFNRAFGACGMLPSPVTGALVEECMLSATQQSVSQISALFSALGALCSGITGFYLGRRGAIQVGCVFVIIGQAGVLGTSGNFAGYIVCKCINAIGLGHLIAVSPAYGVECTPPQKRGMLLGLYTIGCSVGSFVSAMVCYGSADLVTNWAWQIPNICNIPIAVIFGVGILMFPESPRWLLTKGKEEKARKSFGSFYNLDPHSEQITVQVREVQDGIEFEKSISSTTSWTEIFHRSYIRRTLVSTFILAGASLGGIAFIAVYAAIFLADVGIADPFLVNVIFSVCNLAGCLFGPWILEYGGRRTAILIGYAGMTLCMIIFSSVCSGLGATNPIAHKVLIAFLCIWLIFFGGFLSPAIWVAQAEVLSVRLRTYGIAFTATIFYIVSFAATFWTPYMLNVKYGNMGTNVGYFYGGIDAILFLVAFFIVPETARLTLEQIDDYFVSGPRPWRTSLSRNKQIARGEIFDVSAEAHLTAIQHMREGKGSMD